MNGRAGFGVLARRVPRRSAVLRFGREMGLDHSPSNALDFEIEDYASTEFRRIGSDRIGRQTQSWVRFAEGWRVVAAHVSVLM